MILIKGGRVIDPKSGLDELRDVVLEDGVIKFIGKFQSSEEYEQVINAEGKIIAPGLVDVHVHFRDPGLTYKEDMHSGAAAAARGGFTTVVCMANTSPVVDNEQVLAQVLALAEQQSIHVKTVATVSYGLKGEELTDMKALHAMGAVGFSDDGIPLTNPRFLHEAMRMMKELDVPISLHEEEPSLIGVSGINDGRVSAELGIKGAPAVSETAMIARDCMLALDTGAKVHIQHVSCADSVAVIALAKQLGAKVTAEATPQHISLTEQAVLELGSCAKLNPPLRTERDRYGVIHGLKDGTIDMIATDHAPHSREEKERAITDAPSGLTGLETALSVGISHLVRSGHMSLMELLEKMTVNPAKLYGFDAGYLAEGGPADLVIFDEHAHWTVEDFASKSTNSPYLGTQLQGQVDMTICGGKIVYRRETAEQ